MSKEKRVTFRLTYEEFILLNLSAEQAGKSRTEFIRSLLKDHNKIVKNIKENTKIKEDSERLLQAVVEIGNNFTEAYKEILDRLDKGDAETKGYIFALNENVKKSVKAIVLTNPEYETLLKTFINPKMWQVK
jgi:uncharacterized protein (DUF1778 family)